MLEFGGVSQWLQRFSSDSKRRGTHKSRRRPSRRSKLSFESLEAREMMTTVAFNVPADVATKGVYIAAYATLQQAYTPAQGSQIASGETVYFDSTLNNGAGDYATAASGDDFAFQLTVSNGVASIDLPDPYVTAGQIVIGVGSEPIITFNPATSTSPAGFSTPTVTTNPDNYFGLFEYAIDSDGWNIDLSLVEQIGFPFQIDTTPAPLEPVVNGVGIAQNRADLFHLYGQYIASQNANAAPFQRSLTLGEPYGILAPHNVFDNTTPTVTAPSYGYNGNLAIGTTYYYWVTAVNSYGETTVGTYQNATPYTGSRNGHAAPLQTVTVNWDALPGATAYRVYRSTTTNPADAVRLTLPNGKINITGTSYVDAGKASQVQNATPPTTNYSYDPFNSYFNADINSFFSHYKWNGTVNNSTAFSLTAKFHNNYSTFSGYTYDDYQFGGTGPKYTALVLNSADYSGQDFVILRPYFSNNTDSTTLPAAPSWLSNASLSPAAMIFANDGAFNTGGEQPGADSVVLSGLQNSIVSAFNRGIATNYSIAPQNWANAPIVTGAQTIAGGSLAANTTYYYLVTATTQWGETTVSQEMMATTSSANKRIQLHWEPQDTPSAGNPLGYTQYHVYRSTTQGSGYQLVDWPINNWHANNITAFIDNGTMPLSNQTPFTYYVAGTASNWYAAFVHQNATTSPTTGISIDGLGYGFAYDDQGSQSSDFTAVNPTQISITLLPWTRKSSTPSTLGTPLPPPPSSPASLKILTQPLSAKLTDATTIQFKVLTAQGHTFMGGTVVKVELQGPKKQTFYVTTDPLTGLGTLTLDTPQRGIYRLKLTLDTGNTFLSSEFTKGYGKFTKRYF